MSASQPARAARSARSGSVPSRAPFARSSANATPSKPTEPAQDAEELRRKRRGRVVAREARVRRVAHDDAVRAPRQLREGRDVGDHEVHVVGVHDRARDAGVLPRAPEPREVLHGGREARAREAVQEHHPREHDVLGVKSEAAPFEDDGARARLREVEHRREVHVEAQEPRRAPHEVRVLVHAVRPRRRARGGRGARSPEERPDRILAPAFLGDEEERRRANTALSTPPAAKRSVRVFGDFA